MPLTLCPVLGRKKHRLDEEKQLSFLFCAIGSTTFLQGQSDLFPSLHSRAVIFLVVPSVLGFVTFSPFFPSFCSSFWPHGLVGLPLTCITKFWISDLIPSKASAVMCMNPAPRKTPADVQPRKLRTRRWQPNSKQELQPSWQRGDKKKVTKEPRAALSVRSLGMMTESEQGIRTVTRLKSDLGYGDKDVIGLYLWL